MPRAHIEMDIVVEAVEAGLALGHQLRLETAGATRNRKIDFAVLGQDRFRARAVAAVAALAPGRTALFVAEMIADLCSEGPLDQRSAPPSAA